MRSMGPKEPGFGCGGREDRLHHAHGSLRGPGARFFERGGIKFAILEHVKDKPRHGYDIIREMEERSGGLYSPSPGAIYPTLQAIEDQDFISSNLEDGKKVYTITKAGLAYLEENKERAGTHRARWESYWGSGQQAEGSSAVEVIRDSLVDVKRMVLHVANDPARLREIGDVLEEAAQKIRDILKK